MNGVLWGAEILNFSELKLVDLLFFLISELCVYVYFFFLRFIYMRRGGAAEGEEKRESQADSLLGTEHETGLTDWAIQVPPVCPV